MNESYTNAPACKLLATHCVCCGRPLVDSVSVELGIGPECREGINGDLDEEKRKLANQLVFEAALAAQAGHISKVLELADRVEKECWMGDLADKMRRRFVNAERTAKLAIALDNGMLRVRTPFRRKGSAEFIAAWRAIPGRRFKDGENLVPVAQKPALWALLKQFFPGESGIGPQGVFRVPAK